MIWIVLLAVALLVAGAFVVNPANADLPAFGFMRFGARADKAAAALPQTATGTLFTVSGGRVALLGLVGEVVSALGATATNAKILHTPTVGTAVDLCAVLAIASKEAGTLFGISGVFGDAMVGANAGAGILPTRPVVLPPGALGLNTNANNTGTVKWTAYYLPLDDGATLVAA